MAENHNLQEVYFAQTCYAGKLHLLWFNRMNQKNLIKASKLA